MRYFSTEEATLRPWNASIGNHDVQTTVKFVDYGVYCCVDSFLVLDIDLVCFACMERRLIFDDIVTSLDSQCLHLTPYSSSISLARSRASLLLWYQIATFAPDSANAWATTYLISDSARERNATENFFKRFRKVDRSDEKTDVSHTSGKVRISKRKIWQLKEDVQVQYPHPLLWQWRSCLDYWTAERLCFLWEVKYYYGWKARHWEALIDCLRKDLKEFGYQNFCQLYGQMLLGLTLRLRQTSYKCNR